MPRAAPAPRGSKIARRVGVLSRARCPRRRVPAGFSVTAGGVKRAAVLFCSRADRLIRAQVRHVGVSCGARQDGSAGKKELPLEIHGRCDNVWKTSLR